MKTGRIGKPGKAGPSNSGKTEAETRPASSASEFLFALAAGIWIGLTLVKFGNPVIFSSMITPPANFAEWIFVAWPISWGYVLQGMVVVASFKVIQPHFRKDNWPVLLLFFWLFWQILSSARTIDKSLTNQTLVHFISCAVAFLLGYWALGRSGHGAAFWTPILVGLGYVLFSGFDQRHGGLEAVRNQFYSNPNWQLYPREYQLKVQSNRIFSTLVYPNSFAGLLLLFLPVSLSKIWELTPRWPRIARGVVLGLVAYLGLGCLYWTGSKGGWLIALGMIAVMVLHLSFSRKIKVALITAGLLLGLTVFFVRFSAYFQKGATSVGARFIYWEAAFRTAREHPILGTGPGTFSAAFREIKPPDAEMAKLAHNDYLEQASDSGILGAISYLGFISLSLIRLYPVCLARGRSIFLLWLGLVAWALQAVIEFSLYIPSLSWPVFTLFGWLWSLDNNDRPRLKTAYVNDNRS